MELHIDSTSARASRRASDFVTSVLNGVENPVLLLPTGNTPRQLYRELVATSLDTIAWPQARLFALDEYVGVAADDPRSFRYQLWSELCSPLGLSPAQLFSPDGMAREPSVEADRYEEAFWKHRPVSLCVLGVGSNGHIAFNEPGSDQQSLTHVATLSESTRHDNAALFEGGSVPTHALTVGIATIMASEQILLLACGAAKAKAIEKLVAGEPDPAFPVSYLVSHPRLTVIVDEEASGGARP